MSTKLAGENIVHLPYKSSDACVIEDKTHYQPGNTIRDIAVGNFEACAWLCQREPDCCFWSYKASTKRCWLKTQVSKIIADNDFKSGSKACGLSGQVAGFIGLKQHPPGDCGNMTEEGVAYEGNNIRDIKLGNGLAALTADSCAALCKDDDDCKFWRLSVQYKVCQLKTSDAGRKAYDSNISGLKPCN